MALVCFPPDFPIPFREEYCICDSSAYPKFSEFKRPVEYCDIVYA